MTEPPMMVAISAPNAVASDRPTTASPRMRMRTLQSINELNRAVSNQASRIDGAVIFPSRLLVTRRNGMRMIEGNRPK